MKLRDVKFTPAVRSLNDFSKYSINLYLKKLISRALQKHLMLIFDIMFIVDPYVRVLMLNGKTGKKLKKKKTKFLQAVAQPEFNETLTFDLPITHLDTVQFLIVLCSKVCMCVNQYSLRKHSKYQNF